jgi:2,4-dienoyl-CoA reductase-like NADH-dependent reductase (Old Yellow Enzyme family)
MLSLLNSRRTDEYGGGLENRSKILFDIISSIRNQVQDQSFVIAVKLSTSDFTEGEWPVEDTFLLPLLLEQAQVDLIEIAGGNYEELPWVGSGEMVRLPFSPLSPWDTISDHTLIFSLSQQNIVKLTSVSISNKLGKNSPRQNWL